MNEMRIMRYAERKRGARQGEEREIKSDKVKEKDKKEEGRK